MRKAALTAFILVFISFLFSCSYGLLNFSTEVGNMELEFGIEGDNYLGVDNVVYTFTSPLGDTVVFTGFLDGSSSHLYIDRVLAGSWTVTVSLGVGFEVLQISDSYSFEMVTGADYHVDVKAAYAGPEYTISFSSWDRNSGGTAGTSERVFTVDDFRVYPEFRYLDWNSSYEGGYSAVLKGTSFASELNELKLLQPDGGYYIQGWNNSRTILLGGDIGDNLIRIRNQIYDDPLDINGPFIAYLTDHSGNLIRSEYSLDFSGYDSMMPKILGQDNLGEIPEGGVDSMNAVTFQWQIDDSSWAGTVLVYVVSSSGSIYPSDNSILVAGNSGDLSIPGMTLTIGIHQIIIAAIGFDTSTPYDYVNTYGVNTGSSINMRAEGFTDTMQDICSYYRENIPLHEDDELGQVMLYSAAFEVY